MKELIFTALLFHNISCSSQINNQTKTDTMEHFNISKYKDLPLDLKVSSTKEDKTYLYHDLRIRVVNSPNIIQVEEKGVNSPYLTSKIFFKNNNLKSIGRNFYSFPIGIFKEYDESGKLIREVNNDAPYKFSIDDLINKIKKEYDVDIVGDYKDSDKTKIMVSRWLGYKEDWSIYKKNVPMYQVSIRDKEGAPIVLEINALTGDTISKKLNKVGGVKNGNAGNK
ncbi:hypothetical protein PYS58_17960 [Chryseobacterium indologenes]|uniref:hypothetical protein n=1 Tax=Chryseobacterium indologenes TaxID=253 RepID=UPI0023E86A4A|nr:hypothetical protein [Chryseobacterium indologenes]WET48451.1 hypothetical protein PYS58_17960 [Chryseobacterium indologenes]